MQEACANLIDGRRIPGAQSSQTALTESHPARDVLRAFRQTRDEGDPSVIMKKRLSNM